MSIELTVAICTYNRSESLARTLDSFAAQSAVWKGDWELLVIDNNSTDGTSRVVSAYADSLPMRILQEPKQGLSHARNCALESFRGSSLVFTDDDVVVEPDWLAQYATAIRDQHEAGFFGGRVLPLWRAEKPPWLRDEAMPLISGVLVRYSLGELNRWYEPTDPVPFGASFGIRRDVAELVGHFCPDLGPVGRVPGRGDDTTYLEECRRRGVRGYYVGAALAWHEVDTRRLTPRYLFQHGIQKGIEIARTTRPAPTGSLSAAALCLLRGGFQWIKGRGDRARQCVINAGIHAGLRQASTRSETTV